jgi:predicted metal-dependent HD superfamily phosphohydrolase
MNHFPLVTQAKEHVTKYIQEHASKKLIYHTLQHTQAVVDVTKQLVTQNQLDGNDAQTALLAAWFVDTGYYDDYRQHEIASARLAELFLKKAAAPESTIQAVRTCLLATKVPQSPATRPQQVLCDAVFFHLAVPDFGEQNKLIRKELSLLQGAPIDKKGWRKNTLQFLKGHTYFTDYCRTNWSAGKKENLEKLRKKDVAFSLPANPLAPALQSKPTSLAPPHEKAEKKKEDRPEKTIETMFRVTSDKSQKLSDQADTKSNIMISINAIIISVLLSVLLPKLDNRDTSVFIIPVILLLTVSLVTIIFSVLATRPRVPAGTFTPEQLNDKSVNLLFFGNFFKMDFEHYSKGMFQVMDDKHFLYLTLLRDIYTQGIRLGQKYKMLTLAYNVFMYGLILSILVFVIAAFM